MRARQHDAHVRARNRVITRVVARLFDWGRPRWMRLSEKETREVVGRALGNYEWPDGWAMRQTGRYHPFRGYDGPKVPYKDVPARVIHSIMVAAMGIARAQEQAERNEP